MWWICTSSGASSEVGYSRSSGANAGEDHITYPCAMLTIYHYDTKIRYHRKDFLWHEGCFIIAHQLCYRRTSLEENRHLEIIHVIPSLLSGQALSAAKDLGVRRVRSFAALRMTCIISKCLSSIKQARLHCSHGILYHWLYDSCVAFRDKDKKPGDATTVEELIEMSESQGGERKK